MPKRKYKSVEQRTAEQRERVKKRRQDESVRIAEQISNTIAHRNLRTDDNRRMAEQVSDTAGHRIARQDRQRRLAEQVADTAARRITRQDHERRAAEQVADTAARRITRQDHRRRLAEQVADTAARRIARQDHRRRSAEQVADSAARRIVRQDHRRRSAEQVADTAARRIARQDHRRRSAEQVSDAAARRIARQDQERRTAEQVSDTAARRITRQDHGRRSAEQVVDTAARRITRQNSERRLAEQSADTVRQKKKRKNSESSYQKLLDEYKNKIKQSPTSICSCCGGLWYQESTSIVSTQLLQSRGCSDEFIANLLFVPQECHRLCATCNQSYKHKSNQLPKLALSNGFDFPILPDELKDLSPLEERLVAPRLPFMQIRLLGSERQSKLRGNVVNVENNLDICAQVLPRKFDETSTVQVQLMRRLKYRKPYLYETIRPLKVFEAAKYLVSTELYKSENVTLCEDWKMFNNDSTMDFICAGNENPSTTDNEQLIYVDDATISETANEQTLHADNLKTQQKSIEAVGAEETLIFREDDYNAYGIRIAPAEGNIPTPLHRDINAEMLSFPSIYGGVGRNFKDKLKISYTDIAKSELRRYDRRACRPSKLLYSFKRSFNEKVVQAVNICMRKKVGRERITAGNIRTPGYIEKLFTQDKGYPIFKNVRSSPMYWKEKTKKVLAMIRQLGKCTFFITLSAAETKWTELLITLMKVVKNQNIDEEEASNLSFEQIAELIRSDPVTCMRHFDFRYRALLNLLLKKDCGIFSPYKLQDYFSRLEFQMRGSPHSHGLYWIENAPLYVDSDNNSIRDCVQFIDKFITSERSEDGEMKKLIEYQNHKHSHTCRRKLKRGSKCRFGFPKPPMVETRILAPLSNNVIPSERKAAEDLYIKVQEKLNEMGRDYRNIIDYDLFLEQELETTHMDYIYAIRSSIKRPTVFLRRSTNAIFINAYNRDLLEAWRANIDFQFVLDTFACAKYCVGYILKSEGGISKLLQAATKDARKAKSTVRDQLKKVGSILINGSEISAQEAAAFLLGIPNTKCSRQDIFVNTARPEERIGILKPKAELDRLEDDSEDVCSDGIIDHYAKRPTELEEICLAEFATMYEITKMKQRKLKEFESDSDHEDEVMLSPNEISTNTLNDQDVGAAGPSKPEKSKYLNLLDRSRSLRKRRVQKIIRFRHYDKDQDAMNYCREQLMLFVPWRDEERELLSIDCVEKANLNKTKINFNSRPFYWDSEVNDGVLHDILQSLEDQDSDEEYIAENAEDLIGEDEQSEDVVDDLGSKQTRVEKFLKPRMLDNEEYLSLMQNLNERQQRFVMNTLHNLKSQNKTPFYTFLSGGAGVGKSHALTAIVQSYIRYCDKFPNLNPDNLCVIVSAPTGKAAFNVFGMTLHCTFRLPPTQYGGKVGNLEDGALNTLRVRLEGVELFIIDEISMVSVRQLYDIDQRLRQIFATNADFGGKSVVVMGHLRQLPPVAAAYVFTTPRHLPLGDCVGNYLWSHFSLYELTEIMRQRGEFAFCKALNNMAEGCMDANDVALIKSRQIHVDNIPPDEAIRLFKTNNECEVYNSEVHRRLQTDGCLSIALDQVQGNGTNTQKEALLEHAKGMTVQQSDGLPYRTHLQVGGEYFISTNVDVQDGLFNGSTGTLKLIEYGKTGAGDVLPKRSWIDFHNILIGMSKRSFMKSYIEKKSHIHVDWVPIERVTRLIGKTPLYKGLQIKRTQIPVVAANGMTINKSQGSSLPLVVVGVQEYVQKCPRGSNQELTSKKRKRKWLSRELLYVACSRSITLEGLYIDGDFEPPKPPKSDDLVSVEMSRLRSVPLKFDIQFLQDYGEDFEKLYFHNVQSFYAHRKDIIMDHCAMASDFLAFVEPWLLSDDIVDIPGYSCIHRTNCRNVRNSEGALMMSRGTLDYSPLVYVDFESSGHLLFLQSKISGIYVIMVYKSPTYSKSLFLKKITEKLNTICGDILLFGDVNINLRSPEGYPLIELLHSKKLTSKLAIEDPSTDFGTTIDICFSNVNQVSAWFYESYFSYHKPICVVWPKV